MPERRERSVPNHRNRPTLFAFRARQREVLETNAKAHAVAIRVHAQWPQYVQRAASNRLDRVVVRDDHVGGRAAIMCGELDGGCAAEPVAPESFWITGRSAAPAQTAVASHSIFWP